ncbi:hypothetical protein [Szabonella alba]|uniref:Curlin associated repeat-containing protein n=1 Tax=Szabonella alba TaxID=2804194 RepID=A0A8K0Y136_9RHOB|nr:hypothetical protein [Szabonella alba]MBL4918885.1 hypothetical protein [Szabonella alba]
MLLAFSGPVSANGISHENQIIRFAVEGDDNHIHIAQEFLDVGIPDANIIDVEIIGDRNGGFQPWASRLVSGLGLEPGSLSQSGWGNELGLKVTGSDNVFATRQQGQWNVIDGVITGSGNQAAIQQSGIGNNVAFSQSGQRNMIVVSQSTN